MNQVFLWVAVGFPVALLVVAVVSLWLQLRSFRKALEPAIQAAAALAGGSIKDTQDGSFAAVRRALHGVPALSPLTQRLTGAAVYGDGRLYAPTPPSPRDGDKVLENFFVGWRLYPLLANSLVGIGLAFTFFGLIIVLQGSDAVLVNGQGQGNVTRIISGLTQLLGGMQTKFYSSLAGLLSGVIASPVVRHFVGEAKGALNELTSVLESAVPTWTSTRALEVLLQQQQRTSEQDRKERADLTEQLRTASLENAQIVRAAIVELGDSSRQLSGRQEGLLGHIVQRLEAIESHTVTLQSTLADRLGNTERLLKTYIDELVVSLQNALDEKVAPRFSEAMSNVMRELGSIRQDRGSTNEAMMTQVVGEFRQAISGGAGAEMASTVRALEASRAGMEDMARQFQAVTTALREDLVGGAKTSMQELAAQMAKLSAGLAETVAGAGAQASKSLTTTISELEVAVMESTAATKETQKRLADTMEALVTRFESLGASQLSGFDGQLTRTLTSLGARVEQIAEGLGAKLKTATEDTANGVSLASEKLRAAADSSGAILEKTRDTLKETQGAVAALNAASVELRQAQEAVAGVARPLADTTKHLTASAQSMAQAATASQGASTTITSAHEAMKEAYDAHRDRFEYVDRELRDAVNTLISGNKTFVDQVEKFTGGVVNEYSKSLNGLMQAVNALGEQIDELRDQKGRGQ